LLIWVSKFILFQLVDNLNVRWFYNNSDFIEIGNNTILGEGAINISSMVLGDFLLLKKVILKVSCTIGAFNVIFPGNIVKNGVILGMGSYTKINQHFEMNYIPFGRPTKK